MVLRNDYQGGFFVNTSTHPALEVEICTWWTPNLPRNGSLGNVTLSNFAVDHYEVCSQRKTNANGSVNWPAYLFVTNHNVLNVSEMDIMRFVHYVHNHTQSLSGYVVAGVYFGFRIYTGKGSFKYLQEPLLRKIVVSNLACPFSSYNNIMTACNLAQTGDAISNFFIALLSTPNAILLFRLSPIAIVLDEFSYYAYHEADYDRGFKFFVELCYDINNDRWIPPFLEFISKAMDTIQ